MRQSTALRCLVLAVVLASCSSGGGGEATSSETTDGTTSSQPSTTSTTEPEPEVRWVAGDCLPPADSEVLSAHSDTRDPLGSCAEAHGTQVAAVLDLPEPYASAEAPPAFDADAPERRAFMAAIRPLCVDALNALVGEAPALGDATRADGIRWYFFIPSDEEWAAGLRYLRCDVGALLPPGGELSLTGSFEGVRAAPDLAPEHAWCRTASEDHVPCSTPHRGEIKLTGVADVTLPQDPGAIVEVVRIEADFWCREQLDALGWTGPHMFTFDTEDLARTCGIDKGSEVTGITPLG